MTGIQETKEALESLKLLGVAAKKIGADGKINFSDLPVFVDLAQQSSVIAAGFQGVKLVPVELKDLDLVEAQEVLNKMYEVINAIKEA